MKYDPNEIIHKLSIGKQKPGKKYYKLLIQKFSVQLRESWGMLTVGVCERGRENLEGEESSLTSYWNVK